MRIVLSVATALLLAAMTTQASAQADPHHPEGTDAAAETTTGPAAGCPALRDETMGGMPRPELGSSSPMEMMQQMRMMQMMQQMQMMQMMQMMHMQQLVPQMQKDLEQPSGAVK